jgi:hypothetical protein
MMSRMAEYVGLGFDPGGCIGHGLALSFLSAPVGACW